MNSRIRASIVICLSLIPTGMARSATFALSEATIKWGTLKITPDQPTIKISTSSLGSKSVAFTPNSYDADPKKDGEWDTDNVTIAEAPDIGAIGKASTIISTALLSSSAEANGSDGEEPYFRYSAGEASRAFKIESEYKEGFNLVLSFEYTIKLEARTDKQGESALATAAFVIRAFDSAGNRLITRRLSDKTIKSENGNKSDPIILPDSEKPESMQIIFPFLFAANQTFYRFELGPTSYARVEAEVPEPSTYLTASISAMSLFVYGRFRRREKRTPNSDSDARIRDAFDGSITTFENA